MSRSVWQPLLFLLQCAPKVKKQCPLRSKTTQEIRSGFLILIASKTTYFSFTPGERAFTTKTDTISPSMILFGKDSKGWCNGSNRTELQHLILQILQQLPAWSKMPFRPRNWLILLSVSASASACFLQSWFSSRAAVPRKTLPNPKNQTLRIPKTDWDFLSAWIWICFFFRNTS